MSLLELKQVSHAYGRDLVVDALSFSLEQGAIGCLLGPSGCGTTDQHHLATQIAAVHAILLWRVVRHKSNTAAELSLGT